jgi:tRNA dimethylallyltransferase
VNQLVAIVGPTGVGKSSIALRVACKFNGEIVNADSRQVYRYMDIGTAKPTPEECSLVPHHLFDIISPGDSFSLAEYLELAYSAIADIQQRGQLPLLVGGSGQYIRAVLEGWQTPHVPPDREFRERLERLAVEGGGEELYRELAKQDPQAAELIDPRNVRRIIRALEVQKVSGTPSSRLRRKETPPFSIFSIGLTLERGELYRRIDSRVDRMVEQGLVQEVEGLLRMGYHPGLPAMNSIGYRQIVGYLKGETGLESAVQQIKYETRRLVRQQYAWLRPSENRILWFDAGKQPVSEIESAISSFVVGI